MEPDCSFPDLARRPWWRRRFFKVIAGTLLFVAAFYVIERHLGERAWKAYQREAAVKGMEIQMADYETLAIPDEENFAAVPIFQSLFDDPFVSELTRQRFRLPRGPFRKGKEPTLDYLTNSRQAFVKAGWIRSAGDNAAADVLTALERMEPVLVEARLACSRPKTRWPIKWSDPNAKGPILDPLSNLGAIFALRANALLSLNRPDEALVEIRYIARVAESLNDQPNLLFGVVRNDLWDTALEAAEFGLISKKWSVSHAEVLSKTFMKANHLAEWKVSHNGDRCSMNLYLDELMAADSRSFGTQLQQLYSYGAPASPTNTLWSAAPRGWIRRSQATYNRHLDVELNQIDSERELISLEFDGEHVPRLYREYPWAEYYPVNRLIYVASGFRISSEKRAFALHTRARQFPILCALVNYCDAHGEFPESLDQLVPTYLSAVPHDIMDGNPMRYRRTANGGCLVWSIGENRVDEGGKGPDPKRSRKLGPDWVRELPSPKSGGAKR